MNYSDIHIFIYGELNIINNFNNLLSYITFVTNFYRKLNLTAFCSKVISNDKIYRYELFVMALRPL